MKLLKIIFLLFVFHSPDLRAQKVYEFNSTCQQAYQEITKLRINSGLALVQKAREQNPNNLIPELLESYADFYVLFLNEDPRDFYSSQGVPSQQKKIILRGCLPTGTSR